jgi:hypothetical protein
MEGPVNDVGDFIYLYDNILVDGNLNKKRARAAGFPFQPAVRRTPKSGALRMKRATREAGAFSDGAGEGLQRALGSDCAEARYIQSNSNIQADLNPHILLFYVCLSTVEKGFCFG